MLPSSFRRTEDRKCAHSPDRWGYLACTPITMRHWLLHDDAP